MTNGLTKIIFAQDKTMEHIERLCPSIEEDFPEEIHSPTDSSEDSVEVKVEAISIRNKRKCAEPRRVHEGPLKKRMCLQTQVEPFRPWSRNCATAKADLHPPPTSKLLPHTLIPPNHLGSPPFNCRVEREEEEVVPHAYFRPPSPIKRSPSPAIPAEEEEEEEEEEDDEEKPVALVKRRREERDCDIKAVQVKVEDEGDDMRGVSVCANPQNLRVPMHPQVHLAQGEAERMLRSSADAFPRLQQSRKDQRNYKNMTRERRIEANARERTRVHTISAAFDTLRRAIPAYSHSQKLSKLSVLRVACSYIATLSNMLRDDEDQSELEECVEQVTKTIQREGKLRKKKDESD